MSFLLVSPDRTGVGLKSDSFLTAPVKYIPSWFPGAGFKRNAESWRSLMQEFVDIPFEFVKQNMVCFFPPPGVVNS